MLLWQDEMITILTQGISLALTLWLLILIFDDDRGGHA
jgi:hypothetical protein